MARNGSTPRVPKERNHSKHRGITLCASLARYMKDLLQWLTNVRYIAVCGKLSNKKTSSSKSPACWKRVAKDNENKVKHPMSRAILKPKMTGPPWLCARWMIFRPNQFERVSSLTATNASSVASCRALSKEHEMTCAISKIPDATAAMKGMNRVSFHLCRYSSNSNDISNENERTDPQIPWKAWMPTVH